MPVTFTVDAVDPETELVVSLEITAETPEEAKEKAKAKGLAGATVRPMEEPSARDDGNPDEVTESGGVGPDA